MRLAAPRSALPAVLGAVLLSSLPVRASAQSASLPGPPPPVAHGFSVFRLELSRPPRFTTSSRGWTPALHADVAVANSSTRLGLSVARLSAVSPSAAASIGGSLAITQVVVEKESPSLMVWTTGSVGVVGLGHELRAGATAVDVAVGGGAGMTFTPPGIGEVALSVAPRFRWRRLSPIEGLDRSAAGAAATFSLDWGSQRNLGALVALDLEWLSSRPPGARLTRATARLGVSYRGLLFPRKHRLPPPETR